MRLGVGLVALLLVAASGGEVAHAVAVAQREQTIAEAVVLARDADGQPRVKAVVYPLPDYEGGPWSQWGQGLVLADGRFVSAVGDHLGRDGNSYLFIYDPSTSTLTRFADVMSTLGQQPGSWGYGKIHAQIVEGPNRVPYLATYWGTRTRLAYDATYTGDWLFKLETESLKLVPVEVPIPHYGIPSMASWSAGGLIYGEATDPRSDPDGGIFFAYDAVKGEVVYRDDDARHIGFRSILVDSQGNAYFSAGDRQLFVYRPGTQELTIHPERIPGRWLRAASTPAPDGTVFGVTREPDRFFALRPSGTIDDLGEARGYTAVLALLPGGDGFLYVPGAHGRSWQQGTPLIKVDATGRQEVLVELNDMAEEQLGLRLGGTFSIAVDPSRETAYVGFNAGPRGSRNVFGAVVLLEIHLRPILR